MRVSHLLFVALLVSGALGYYVEIQVKIKNPYYYIGPYDVNPGTAVVSTVYNGYNVTGSPSNVYFMFSSSSCNDCFDCGLANHYVLQSGISYLTFSYSSDYVTLGGGETKTVCHDECAYHTGKTITIGYDIPWYYTMDAVIYNLTFRK